MKVVYIESEKQTSIVTLTVGKTYDVVEVSYFGNRYPDYKVVNNNGTPIWVSSNLFEKLNKKRELIINSLLD
jgi:hypothetical protein